MDTIIFDMDGTLVDTAKVSVRAVRQAARELHCPIPSAEEIRRTIGWANPEFYYRLFPGLSPSDVSLIGERAESLELEMIRDVVQELPFPGIRQVLEKLKTRGARLYLASTGDAAHVKSVMGWTGLDAFFDTLHYGEPDKTAMLSRILSHRPHARHRMIGDTEKDADAARANKIRSIGAAYGYCDESRWSLFDEVAHTPADILRLLDD